MKRADWFANWRLLEPVATLRLQRLKSLFTQAGRYLRCGPCFTYISKIKFACRAGIQWTALLWKFTMPPEPTRYMSDITMSFVADFIIFCAENLNLSPDEFAIMAILGSESNSNLKKSKYNIQEFGYEFQAYPEMERIPVSIKYIQSCLSLSRETIRRRLDVLAQRNFIIKVKGGYLYREQVGKNDQTKELRAYTAVKLKLLFKSLTELPER